MRANRFYLKPNSTALAFLIMGAVWFVVGAAYGIIGALHLVSPELFQNIPALVFGRVRPVHVNTVIFGFVGCMLIGGGLYFVPALLGRTLWSEPLGWIGWLFWNLTVLSGPITFAFGWSQGREYAEYVWIADVFQEVAVLVLLFDLIMTVLNRTEEYLYVAVWYFVGTFLWHSGVYFIGNIMWRPHTGALSGILDAIILWFYGHNLPGLLLTPLATAAEYYVIPRVVNKPIYSHTLGIIAFWTLVAFYTHIGGHHIIQAPIPNWLREMSVAHSMAMAIPVFTVLANLWLTARGAYGSLVEDLPGRFVLLGTIWYLLTCIQGPLQATMFLQRVTHLNNWTVGHAHMAVLGFSGFIALGTMWHVVPLITGRKIWSRMLMSMQFWMITIGLSGFIVVLTIAGLIQGQAWFNGEMVYRVLPEIFPYMALRLGFGVLVIAAALLGLYNLVMSWLYAPPLDAGEAKPGGDIL